MSGGDELSTDFISFINDCSPFDLWVAEEAGAGGESVVIGIQKRLNNLQTESLTNVEKIYLKIELIGNFLNILALRILAPGEQV